MSVSRGVARNILEGFPSGAKALAVESTAPVGGLGAGPPQEILGK